MVHSCSCTTDVYIWTQRFIVVVAPLMYIWTQRFIVVVAPLMYIYGHKGS